MTRSEFYSTITYLTAAIGKPIADGEGTQGEAARKARLDVYFDLLGDLPADAFLTAAKRVAVEHVWATFPTVAELRQAAAETLQGAIKHLSPAEAWTKAWNAVKCIDPEIPESVYRHTGHLPPLVLEAMKAFPLVALIYAKPDFARPQFIKIYEGLIARENRHALLPASVKKSITEIGKREAIESKPIQLALTAIGSEAK